MIEHYWLDDQIRQRHYRRQLAGSAELIHSPHVLSLLTYSTLIAKFLLDVGEVPGIFAA